MGYRSFGAPRLKSDPTPANPTRDSQKNFRTGDGISLRMTHSIVKAENAAEFKNAYRARLKQYRIRSRIASSRVARSFK